LIEKRTLVFVTLAVLVWASIATSFTTYYYLEQTVYKNQLNEKQQSLNELAVNYDESATKQNFLGEEYGKLYGEYQYSKSKGWFIGENCTILIYEYSKILSYLNSNYSNLLNNYRDLNETYIALLNRTQILTGQSTITEEEFDQLLEKWYALFVSLAMKELESSIGEMIMLKVNLCIDYGNGTLFWYNDTSVPSGSTLFDLTRKIATVDPTYSPDMAPGHIFINSINGWAQGWWIWYYWDEGEDKWVFGPVGCDAWILKNDGIYKWICSS